MAWMRGLSRCLVNFELRAEIGSITVARQSVLLPGVAASPTLTTLGMDRLGRRAFPVDRKRPTAEAGRCPVRHDERAGGT